MKNNLIQLSPDVKELCLPHFSRLNIDHLNYIHRDNNGYVTYLCSNEKWLSHYLEKDYSKIGAFENKESLHRFKYILWNGLDKNDPILLDSKEMIGVEHGITIIKEENDGYGFYNIGKKSSDSSIINQYINHLDEYDNFINQFQFDAFMLLSKAKQSKLILPPQHDNFIHTHDINIGKLHLTQRECECIKYLVRGKTAEETSIILGISKRTVESHIENIKLKIGCHNQFRLGYLLGKMGINLGI